ncbi:MAG TPA: HepT-like ribonuclease domain-containing protein [Stellaceae bacterium]|nr:HepT-like ribonuclease domain-containing protein [Stellaceae bacterium]
MSSSDPARRLRDILENIRRIRAYLAGMTAEDFAADEKTQDAVERCLSRISEAARMIGPALDAKYPEIEFPKLRQLGSVLRHDYDDIDCELLWRAVTGRLDALEAACRSELGEQRPSRRSIRPRV